jgi:mono/diheme cytochrome c family protein
MKIARRAAVALVAAGCAASTAIGMQPARSPAEHRADEGLKVFRTYCVGCHGLDAAGCGTSARLYLPRPANLTASTRSSEYKAAIIRNGGGAMGRSQFMPPWVGQLDADDIENVITYLGTLTAKANPSC